MIRGVSDLVENKDDTWRQYACHAAAAYALALLQSGPVPLAVPVASETIKPSEPADTISELTSFSTGSQHFSRRNFVRLLIIGVCLFLLIGGSGRLFYTSYLP